MAPKKEEKKVDQGMEVAPTVPVVDVAAKLDEILNKVNVLEEQGKKKDAIIEDQGKKITLLESAADKGRLENARSKTPGKITPIVKVSTYDGQIIVAWRMLVDEVYKDENGVWHENQKVEITLESGDKKQLSYVDFSRADVVVKVGAEIVRREQSNVDDEFDPETGVVTKKENFILRLVKDKREITLDGRFIN